MDLKALVVDDEQLAREELSFLLAQVAGVEVVGQAANGIEAMGLIEDLSPDLIFLDVQMPGMNGFEVARQMLGRESAAAIVFVTPRCKSLLTWPLTTSQRSDALNSTVGPSPEAMRSAIPSSTVGSSSATRLSMRRLNAVAISSRR